VGSASAHDLDSSVAGLHCEARRSVIGIVVDDNHPRIVVLHEQVTDSRANHRFLVEAGDEEVHSSEGSRLVPRNAFARLLHPVLVTSSLVVEQLLLVMEGADARAKRYEEVDNPVTHQDLCECADDRINHVTLGLSEPVDFVPRDSTHRYAAIAAAVPRIVTTEPTYT